MAENTRALKERVLLLLKQGNVEAARESYQEICSIDGKDYTSRQKLGELLLKLGDVDGAVANYVIAAQGFASTRDPLKAIALCKVVLDYDRGHNRALELLSQLNFKRGNSTSTESAAIERDNEKKAAALERLRGRKDARDKRRQELVEWQAEQAKKQSEQERVSMGDIQSALDAFDETTVKVVIPEILHNVSMASILGEDAVNEDDVDEIAQLTTTVVAKQTTQKAAGPPGATRTLAQSAQTVTAASLNPASLNPASSNATSKPVPTSGSAFVARPQSSQTSSNSREGAPSRGPPIPLFSDLDEEAFLDVAQRMRTIDVDAGQAVVKEGDKGNTMYVLVQGRVAVHRQVQGKTVQLGFLSDGAFFGEMALVSFLPRTATVTAVERTKLFEIDRALVDEVARLHPRVYKVLHGFCEQRMVDTFVRSSPLFADVKKEDRDKIGLLFEMKRYRTGQTVLDQARPGVGIFLIVSGTCDVVRKDGATSSTLGQLGSGDVFGEMSFLYGDKTSAAVVASSDSIVFFLEEDARRELWDAYPGVLTKLMELSSSRMKENRAVLGEWVPPRDA